MKKLIALVGPTAAGKTSLAYILCRRFRGEIISVDSRQQYRRMDLGTGKDLWSRPPDVAIHLYDFLAPDQLANIFDFAQVARRKLKELWADDKLPLLVGGTGFYLDIILRRRHLANVPPDLRRRDELSRLSLAKLFDQLQRIDPVRASTIDRRNPHRLIRAVEVAEGRQGGLTQDGLESENLPQTLILGLTAKNELLFDRADRRIEQMVEQGLVEEVRHLVQDYGWLAPGLKTLGYSEFRPFLAGRVTLAEAVERLKFNTHAYIRRQKTYFKKNPAVVWFDISQTAFEKQLLLAVESFLATGL